MYDNLSFNTTKLNEIYEMSKKYYDEYKETIYSLDQEIKSLETSWGKKDQSLYSAFKEKYEEKKGKLESAEQMMKELLDTLEAKKEEIEETTVQSEKSFE